MYVHTYTGTQTHIETCAQAYVHMCSTSERKGRGMTVDLIGATTSKEEVNILLYKILSSQTS